MKLELDTIGSTSADEFKKLVEFLDSQEGVDWKDSDVAFELYATGMGFHKDIKLEGYDKLQYGGAAKTSPMTRCFKNQNYPGLLTAVKRVVRVYVVTMLDIKDSELADDKMSELILKGFGIFDN